MSKYSFDNQNPENIVIHDGAAAVHMHHMLKNGDDTNCNFIAMISLPVGSSIGLHRHKDIDEEIYVIVDGQGEMQEGEKTFAVKPGDVIINAPGEQHSLCNTGDVALKLVALDVAVTNCLHNSS
ncbi:MAG: cupin domain-containing protein [Gammaproteobacteria bacterium]|nr:cupin domain-containing protein [Gammaproteobacteria bacterium]